MEKKRRKILPQNNAPHLPPGGVSIFMAIVVVLQLILFLLHFMIYRTLVAAFDIGGLWLEIVLFILSCTFVSATMLTARSKSAFARLYYKFTAFWFSFVAPLCGACAGFVIIKCLFPLLGWFVPSITAGAICFGVAVLVTLYGIWNGMHIRNTRISVALPNLPAFWKNKKIVFFADTHLGALWGRGLSERVAEKITAVAPETVLIGGDLYDGQKCDAERVIEPLKALRPPLGIYFISGNHEYIRDHAIFFDAASRAGIHILKNEKIDLKGIDLIGVDYLGTEKKEKFATVLSAISFLKDRPSILLKHEPSNLDLAERAGVSLNLSGHTHYGQFFPLSLITRYIYGQFCYGFSRFGNMASYTTSGVGTWVSPFRFGTKAEIVEIELV